MTPVIVIELLILAFFVLLIAELVNKFLPKQFKAVVRGVALIWIGWNVFDSGLLGDFKETPPQTVATLLEQANGDKLHWNQFGKPATKLEQRTHRSYQETCQIYALKQLGELGPKASNAVPELVELFNRLEDHNTGDGVLQLQMTAAKTLGLIGHPDAIEPLVGMLKKKSLSPDSLNRKKIRWHDRTYELDTGRGPDGRGNGGRSYLKRGAGPQGIVMGLMLMPRAHHAEIVDQLKDAYAEIERSELFNEWSKFEINRALRYFEADKTAQENIQSAVGCSWCIDDDHFEKALSPKSAPSINNLPTKAVFLTSDGQWGEKIIPFPERKKRSVDSAPLK